MKSDKIRLHLELSRADETILNENAELDDAASRTEAIRKALRLHNAMLKLTAKGGKVIFRTDTGEDTHVLVI